MLGGKESRGGHTAVVEVGKRHVHDHTDQWEKDSIYWMRDEIKLDAAYMEKQYKDEEQANLKADRADLRTREPGHEQQCNGGVVYPQQVRRDGADGNAKGGGEQR